jgi:hypothetical protein
MRLSGKLWANGILKNSKPTIPEGTLNKGTPPRPDLHPSRRSAKLQEWRRK